MRFITAISNGVLTTLFLIFVVLKLFSLITISWLWVFSPIWLPLALAIPFLVLFLWFKNGDLL